MVWLSGCPDAFMRVISIDALRIEQELTWETGDRLDRDGLLGWARRPFPEQFRTIPWRGTGSIPPCSRPEEAFAGLWARDRIVAATAAVRSTRSRKSPLGTCDRSARDALNAMDTRL